MTGDFTSVPLRAADRWTAARMQQGRVLLDTDWNLNLDGPARDARELAADTIGFAGVPAGSSSFAIDFVGGVLTISAGTFWIGGLLARNPTDLAYSAQAEIDALPATGLAVVYLDAFVEEVQAAEDPVDLLDPALDGIDTTTRTRVGWRVHTLPSTSTSCSGTVLPPAIGTGTLDVTRTAAPVAADPCAPPDDPRSKLPDGLLRIEVIDGGTESTARFAWSYADGGDAVAASVAGAAVTLAPSQAVTFAPGDLVEVSTLARRADRRDHGALFTVSAVTAQAGGDLVTLATASALAGNPPGTCLRRWDGQVVGAAGSVVATLGGGDVGIAFSAKAGSYEVGEWWGVRVRGSAADAVETLTAAPPDGVVHAMTPLAVVDLGAKTVASDCRPTFVPLTDLRGGTCTVTAFPGDDLQAALDALPATGGELCLAAGTYPLGVPLTVTKKERVVVIGVGPSTILVAENNEAALIATECNDIEVTHLRVQTAKGKSSPPGDPGLLGGLTFLGCDGVRVHDCEVTSPDGDGRAQSGIYVAPDLKGVRPGAVEISDNRLEVGDLQVGILVASANETTISGNSVVLSAAPAKPSSPGKFAAHQLGLHIASNILSDNVKGGATIKLSDDKSIRVGGAARIRTFAAEWAAKSSPKKRRSARTDRVALARFATSSATDAHQATIGKGAAGFLAGALTDTRAIGQGIVVGGDRSHRVRVEGNEVTNAVQGIHLGLHAPGKAHVSLQQVVIVDNTVACSIPFFWVRQRHAYYVGNVVSLTMRDNHAQLVRTGVGTDATPVDAVRIWGVIGSYLQISGVDLAGAFAVGVRVHDSGPGPRQGRAVQHISDVLNFDGTQALVVPTYVSTERCVP